MTCLVDDSRLNFLKAFRSGINDTISRQGLDPEDFTLEDIEGSNVVRVSGSVSPEDATTLETAFRSRLARRPAEPLPLTIGLDDSLQSPEDGEMGKQAFGEEFTLPFRVGGVLLTHPGLSMADLIQALEAKTDPRMRKVEVRCNISAPLSDETPLVAIDFSRSAEMVERVDVSAGRGIYAHNGTLQFDDQNLQRSMNPPALISVGTSTSHPATFASGPKPWG